MDASSWWTDFEAATADDGIAARTAPRGSAAQEGAPLVATAARLNGAVPPPPVATRLPAPISKTGLWARGLAPDGATTGATVVSAKLPPPAAVARLPESAAMASKAEFWACGAAFTDDDDGATATAVATSDDAFASDFWACAVIEEAEHEAALNEPEFEIFLCAPSDGDFAHPPFP